MHIIMKKHAKILLKRKKVCYDIIELFTNSLIVWQNSLLGGFNCIVDFVN